MFFAGWCLAVMHNVKPSVPQPEVGRTYETWSAGPRYLTRGEYYAQAGLMWGGFILGAGSAVTYVVLQRKDRRP